LEFTPNLKEHEPEMEAIVRGVQWVKGKGKRKVSVISDCKTVVDSVNSRRNSNYGSIRNLIDSDEWDATLSWIRRGQNGEADKLADKANSCRSLELHQSENRSYLLNLNNQIPHPWYV
jgi:ribonuclease HI